MSSALLPLFFALQTGNPLLKAASAVVTPLLKPVFKLETPLQTAITGALAKQDLNQIKAEIDDNIRKGCVVYTYALSPFSTEAIAVLESTGCKFEVIELGQEWFLLGPKASATRSQLGEMTGQTSLPHVFIGGEWVGGIFSGGTGGGGLSQLAESGELVNKLKGAGAL